MRLAWLALAALAAPAVAAQVPGGVPATLTLAVEGAPEPLVPLRSLGQWTVNVTYCYLVPGALAQSPTSVALTIADAPAWATLTVSPQTLLVPVGVPTEPEPAAEVCSAPQSAVVYAAVSDAAPLGASADVTVNAHADANAPIDAADGSAALTIRVASAVPAAGASGTRDPVSNATRNATLPDDLRGEVLANGSAQETAADEKRGIPALTAPLAALAVLLATIARRRKR